MGEVVEFDKVIFCTGAYQNPFVPKFGGSEGFRGKMIHSQAFKRFVRVAGWEILTNGL